MLGAITGDTVGSVYEFHNTKDYNFPLFTPDSGFTDDSEEREGPDMCHESKLNLAHYYMKLKRYEEAMSTLPDTTSPGGRQLLREIREAKEGRSTQPIFPEL